MGLVMLFGFIYICHFLPDAFLIYSFHFISVTFLISILVSMPLTEVSAASNLPWTTYATFPSLFLFSLLLVFWGSRAHVASRVSWAPSGSVFLLALSAICPYSERFPLSVLLVVSPRRLLLLHFTPWLRWRSQLLLAVLTCILSLQIISVSLFCWKLSYFPSPCCFCKFSKNRRGKLLLCILTPRAPGTRPCLFIILVFHTKARVWNWCLPKILENYIFPLKITSSPLYLLPELTLSSVDLLLLSFIFLNLFHIFHLVLSLGCILDDFF